MMWGEEQCGKVRCRSGLCMPQKLLSNYSKGPRYLRLCNLAHACGTPNIDVHAKDLANYCMKYIGGVVHMLIT